MASGFPRAPASTTPAPPRPSAPSLTGAPLVRRLARLTEPVPAEQAPLAERLGQWLHWTDAAALHAALDSSLPATPIPTTGTGPEGAVLAQALRRAREAMARTIEADCAAARSDIPPDADFTAWRRVVSSRLQAVQAGLAPLRQRLRAALAQRSPPHARLAAVDAVLERALGAQERLLLTGTLPSLLQGHFNRLRAEAAGPDSWHEPFCRELHALLLDALDLSLQPLEGLLAALHAVPTES